MSFPFTRTRPVPIHLRASVREPSPALEMTRSRVLSGRSFTNSSVRQLFVAQGHNRVDAGGTKRGQPAGKSGGCQKEGCDHGESERVLTADAEEEGLEQG